MLNIIFLHLRSFLCLSARQGWKLLKLFYVNPVCIPIENAHQENPLPDPWEVKLFKAIPSNSGYMIRPFVGLYGQTKGYQWEDRQRGLWRDFLDSHIKKFTLEMTGKNRFFKAKANV